MKTNLAVKAPPVFTAEGAQAARITSEQQLRRMAAACMLFEDNFYVSGKAVAEQIRELVGKVSPEFAAAVAFEARSRQQLRHLPLWIVREMARQPAHKALVARFLPNVIQRADEIAEFLSLYWADGRQAVSAAVKKGLAKAFLKFDEYQLAKYDRDGAVKLRDALFLCHAKPDTPEREALWKRLVAGQLATPDTWETRLSAGADKKASFEQLMAEGTLGGMAFIRNLRNMKEAGVPEETVRAYAATAKVGRVLPFRFIAAARAVPQWEPIIEPMMLAAVEGRARLPGRTVVLVDVSASMHDPIAAKSDLTRLDAACGVAVLLREITDYGTVLTFSNQTVSLPPRRGFALRDAIVHSQTHSGTYLGASLEAVNGNIEYDRIIVITDEQTADRVPAPKHGAKGYVINVAANKNGVGYGAWHHIDGWSEAVIDYVVEYERLESEGA